MAGDQMKQRRDTAAGWNTNNRVLGAGEFGLETDTRKVKFGDGVTPWNALNYINYLPLDGKAANADKLDGFDSSEFILGTDATTAATAGKIPRRLSDGRLKAAGATEDDDLLTFLQFKGSGRYRGSGNTAFPTTDLVAGDTYLFSGYGMFIYTGSTWRQLYPLELTEAARNSLVTTGAAATAALYIGFRVLETDTRRVWSWGGSTPGWEYVGGGIAPTQKLTLVTANFDHYTTVNPGQATKQEDITVTRMPGGLVLLTGLMVTRQALSGNTWYQVVASASLPSWAKPSAIVAQTVFIQITGQSFARMDIVPENADFSTPQPGSIGFYCFGSVGSGSLVNVNVVYSPRGNKTT